MTSKPAGGGKDQPEKEPDAVPADIVDSTTSEGVDSLAVETTIGVENEATASELTESDTDVQAESSVESTTESEDDESTPGKRRFAVDLPRLVAFVVIPGAALVLAAGGGYLKWQSMTIRASQVSGIDSVGVAKDATIAMLSYQPDTVEKDLGAARDRLTGTFKDSYTQLTHDVVIPGAKQRHISAVATVPAVASVSATANHAVVLVFVNQTVVVGNDAPSASASSVRVTLDKVGDRWMVSGFDPV